MGSPTRAGPGKMGAKTLWVGVGRDVQLLVVNWAFCFADVEELSAKLSLMAASSSEKGEILDPKIGPISDGNYLNNRCVYLEQLLNGKIPDNEHM